MTEAAPAVPGPAARASAAGRASRLLGAALLEQGEGTAVLRMTVPEARADGHGTAHGGHLFRPVGAAFARARNSHGPVTVTVASGTDVTFVAPAREGDVLAAGAREVTRSGRGGVHDVSVVRGETVTAESRGRSRSVRNT